MNADEQLNRDIEAQKKEAREKYEETQQIVTFMIGSEEYGIDIMKVQEIILVGELTRVPEVPSFIVGVINLRGNVIPIIDLRMRFHKNKGENTEETRIIVVNVGEKTMGIIVDAVSEVLRYSKSDCEEAASSIAHIGNGYIAGLIKLENRLLILLDIEKVLSLKGHIQGTEEKE